MLTASSTVVVIVYIVGASLNFVSLCICCRKNKWQELDNVKYLIVTQALLSFIAIASRLGLVLVEFLPQTFCGLLPAAFVFSLSLALFNFAVFAVVKHAQLTSTWRLRFSSALLMIVAVLMLSTVLELPVIYSAAKLSPIVWVTYDGPGCPSRTFKEDVLLSINVVWYASAHIFLLFIIPGIIIINRLLLISLYLWKAELKTIPVKLPESSLCLTGRLINVLCQMAFVVLVFLFLARVEDDPKTLDFLNNVFHNLSIAAIVVLCFNVVLLDATIETTQKDGKSYTTLDDKPLTT